MKVLLTRRRADSERSAKRLLALGFEPLILPLFEIAATNMPRPDIQPDFLIFTSAAAVEVTDITGESTSDVSLPAYAVGGRTAEAVQSRGYKNVRTGPGDASGLAALISSEQPSGSRGLYVCGEDRSFDFAQKLTEYGIQVELWEVYSIRETNPDTGVIREVFQQAEDGASLIYSPKGARNLLRTIKRAGVEDLAARMHFVAISQNCADAITQAGRYTVRVAAAPNEDAMFDVLKVIA